MADMKWDSQTEEFHSGKLGVTPIRGTEGMSLPKLSQTLKIN